jgi:hypothetical protein
MVFFFNLSSVPLLCAGVCQAPETKGRVRNAQHHVTHFRNDSNHRKHAVAISSIAIDARGGGKQSAAPSSIV